LLGQFFGALIKSAVSRQREFLADASAVQFTRNPDGIGEALSIIGGSSFRSKLDHENAHEVGHLFFSSAGVFSSTRLKLFSLFSTHPPLEQRIVKILPRWRGAFIKPESSNVDGESEQVSGFAEDSSYVNSTVDKGQSIDVNDGVIEYEPDIDTGDATFVTRDDSSRDASVVSGHESAYLVLTSSVHEPYDAQIIVMALLFDAEPGIRQHQLSIVEASDKKWAVSVVKMFEHVSLINAGERLTLVELAVPSLKLLSLSQYKRVRAVLTGLIHADGKVDLFEWLLFQLLKQYCDRHFGLSKPAKLKYKNVKQVAKLFEIVLSRVVHYGQGNKQEKLNSFHRGCNAAGTYTLTLLPINECSQTRFTQALSELSKSYPLIKPRLIKGLIQAAKSDEIINSQEKYIIKGVAAVMDCPIVGLELDARSES